MTDCHSTSRRHPVIGGLLIASPALTLFAMLHHPVAHGNGDQSHVDGLARIAGLASLVHGALIVLMVSTTLLLGEFSVLRLQRQALARAGFCLYLLGTSALAGAALVNGFAVSSLVQSAAATSPGIDAALALAWQLNQALAGSGSIALALAIGIWSCDLIQAPGLRRLTGSYGLIMGCGLSLAWGTGWLHPDVQGMLLALVLIAIWQAAAGILSLRD
jgi:hypothetical protein